MCGEGRTHNKLQWSSSIGGKASDLFLIIYWNRHFCSVSSIQMLQDSVLCWNFPGEEITLLYLAASAAHHEGLEFGAF